MILLVAIFGVVAAALAAEASRMTRFLKITRAESALLRAKLAAVPPPQAPAPVRLYECRREHLGLLWFLTMTVRDDGMQVTRVTSGLPHCPRCVCPLKLVMGSREEWVCVGCEARHPGTNADLRTTDELLTMTLREFFARHPDFSPAPGLAGPKFEPPLRRAPHPTPRPAYVVNARRKMKRVLI